MNQDQVFYLDDEKHPDVEACLMHPHLAPFVIQEIEKELEGFGGVKYGLCKKCWMKDKTSVGFRAKVDAEITKRLKTLKKENSK